MQDELDNRLLERFRRGDVQAFEELFARHYARVYRAAYGLVASHAAADDLAQEAFLALYQRPPDPQTGTPVVAWLCRVALNRGSNLLRGERRAQLRLTLIGVDDPPDPGENLLRAEEYGQVRTALASLPERQAQILVLRAAGLSYAEIAAATELAAGSIGTLLARAERALLAAYAALDEQSVVSRQ